jgi:hypothetical protein
MLGVGLLQLWWIGGKAGGLLFVQLRVEQTSQTEANVPILCSSFPFPQDRLIQRFIPFYR